MYEFKPTAEEFHIISDYFITNKMLGGVKYFWEIAVPDDEFIPFTKHLRQADFTGLSFAFACIERYKGYQLLYGFSNFEVQGTEHTKLFDFKFENDDKLFMKFADWCFESHLFYIDRQTKEHLEIMKGLANMSEEEKINIRKFQQSIEKNIKRKHRQV